MCADTVFDTLPAFEPGWVWLAGAGPGDPGLMSLHCLNGLRQADVVVYDALVGVDVLAHARAGAVMEFAGKRGGKPSPKQRDISSRLVELARSGKRVLRLKGGDPFIFGRGGEEARALVRAAIPFRVIPGISAGVGGLAYAGIPLTDRLTNQAVTFVTAHGAGGELASGVQWELFAKMTTPLVIYMALNRLQQISDCLIDGGRDADQPVAIVSRATLSDQKVLETTLRDCARDAMAADIPGPAMMVVGDIVRLRSSLDWIGAEGGKILDGDPMACEGLSEVC